MKQTSSLTTKLTEAQVNATRKGTGATRFQVYTQDQPTLHDIIDRYFSCYSVKSVDGVYQGAMETGAIIEIIGTPADLQTVVSLAGDIKTHYSQDSVLVTWETVNRLDI